MRDNVKLVQLVRAWDCPQVVGSIPAKTQQTENSNLHGFEIRRPSSKGTILLFQVIKAIINQSKAEGRESERRGDGGHAREKEGQGESGARRDCVCERGGVCWHARSEEREREYERLHSENQHLRDLPRKDKKSISQGYVYILPFWA